MFDRQNMPFIALVGLMIFVLSACVSAGGQAEVSIDDLANTRWKLVSYGEIGQEAPVVEGSLVTLEIGPGGQIGGTGGCNSYGGEVTLQGGKLTVGEITSTLMACMDELVMDQEGQYFAALNNASGIKLDGNELTILYDEGRAALNFVVAPDSDQE